MELAIILHIGVIIWPVLPHGRSYPTIPYVTSPDSWLAAFQWTHIWESSIRFTLKILYKVGNVTQKCIVHVFAIKITLIWYLVFLTYKHKELEQSLIQPNADYNPDLPIDEQTSCIPYDPKWEFPKKRLRQGKFGSFTVQIGSSKKHLCQDNDIVKLLWEKSSGINHHSNTFAFPFSYSFVNLNISFTMYFKAKSKKGNKISICIAHKRSLPILDVSV